MHLSDIEERLPQRKSQQNDLQMQTTRLGWPHLALFRIVLLIEEDQPMSPKPA
jgi:hypothetical protein